VSVYLDASALAPIFLDDPFSDRVEGFLNGEPDVVVSDFAAAEFASVVSRQARMRLISEAEARSAFTAFDAWAASTAGRATTEASDVRRAEAFVRRLDLGLRAPDAIHIAIALRLGADLLTFDLRMADAARLLGLDIAAH